MGNRLLPIAAGAYFKSLSQRHPWRVTSHQVERFENSFLQPGTGDFSVQTIFQIVRYFIILRFLVRYWWIRTRSMPLLNMLMTGAHPGLNVALVHHQLLAGRPVEHDQDSEIFAGRMELKSISKSRYFLGNMDNIH